VKIICSGKHGSNFVTQELYVICLATSINATDLVVKCRSDPFVLTGRRDQSSSSAPVNLPVIQNPPVHEANNFTAYNFLPVNPTYSIQPQYNTCINNDNNIIDINNSAISELEKLPNQFQETAHPTHKENPPTSEPIIPVSPYVLDLYDDFEPTDFGCSRFAN